ncbi:acyltransferase family protein [Escherichia coli]|uniref:acyltransferase family protein n=1 Tax=Escherichia coli TaxID=562 RepID=UPI000941EF57|nr:acyltransferase [Escherichia coli]OKV10314.1 hypothetical protein AWP52_15750 [Escherichia coli]OKV96561.1 hypothetical protein AWP65_18620 [Escherichia coli]
MKNFTSIDYAKLFLSFCIVFLHTDIFGGNNNYIGYITCQGLLRVAVPIFFVISGYFYYNSTQKKNNFRWFFSNIKTYVLWTILYTPIMIGVYGYLRNGDTLSTEITYIAFNLLFGFWHLWFFPALIIAAALTSMTKNISAHIIFPLWIVLYILGAYLQYRANYSLDINRDTWSLANVFFSRNGLFFGFPLFYAGFLLNKFSIHIKSNSLLIISIVLVIFEASVNYHYGNHAFDMLFSLPLASIVIFSKLSQINVNCKSTLTIRSHSKNIYLVQIYAIQISKHLSSDWMLITFFACIICIGYSYINIFSKKALANITPQKQLT